MIAIIVIILLVVIACAVAPDAMSALFGIIAWLAGAAIVIAIIGGVIALAVHA